MISLLLSAAACAQQAPPERARIDQVAALLVDDRPVVGRPIDDRAAWQSLAAHPAYAEVVRRAEPLLDEPLPEQPDELYLEFSRNGNRTRWQSVAGRRRGRIATLTLAECVENQGRFIPPLEEAMRAICAERCWTLPAHDTRLTNFRGEQIDIDLGAAHLGGNLATAVALLGERLDPEVAELVRATVRERILDPFRAMVLGERERNWWLTGTNNWNTVCLAGVVGTALAMIDDRDDLALFILAGADYANNFLRGFTADGYCSEGVGYWNYGFGNFITLSELIRQATGGGIDLISRETARAPALYGTRIEIAGGVCPAFADCSVTARPSAQLVWYINRYFGLGLPGGESDGISAGGQLYEAILWSFGNAAADRPPAPAAELKPEPRTWFAEAGIYLGRPVDAAGRLAVALKGGHNAEHHNHNDVGSYTVVLGRRPVLLDPGGEVYTARTFSSRRYESRMLNSFGHPVPRVGGQLQRTGRDARGELLHSEFTEQVDTLEFDLTACYSVESLRSLKRRFVYSREGSLTVTDTVEFSEPTAFGTALITGGDWLELEPGRLLVWSFDEAVEVTIDAEGGELAVEPVQIEEDAAVQPLRLGLEFTAPVTQASVTVAIRPGTHLLADEGTLLRNGSFERGAFGWDLRDGMSSISDEQATAGDHALKITDESDTRGSSVTSSPVPVTAGAGYRLTGRVYTESGGGLGLYVRYLDEDGQLLNELDARGNMPALGTAPATVGEWTAFDLPFTPPADCVAVEVWIHSFNAARVTVYLDELAIVPK